MLKRSSNRTNRRHTLRKHATETVNIEETFFLSNPIQTNCHQERKDEDFSAGNSGGDCEPVGQGCYISCTTSNNKRFYGVMVEQSALQAASDLFMSDQVSGLDLNQRMETLMSQRLKVQGGESHQSYNGSHTKGGESVPAVSQALISGSSNTLKSSSSRGTVVVESRKVEQYQYVPKNDKFPGCRNLLATYANVSAAAQFDTEKELRVKEACDNGGNYVDEFYFQYQVPYTTLVNSSVAKNNKAYHSIHTSMGLHSFLHHTDLPTYFPLSNISGSSVRRSSVMNMLNLNPKRGTDTNEVILNTNGDSMSNLIGETETSLDVTRPRDAYKICIVGAGIAGLACAHKLLATAEESGVSIEVKMFEAQSQIGGRIRSDCTSFKHGSNEKSVCLDLGAQFIHGMDGNPLTNLAEDAGLTLLNKTETIKMLGGKMSEIDDTTSTRSEKIFNDLLDDVVDQIWNKGDNLILEENDVRSQCAIRWYSSVFSPTHKNQSVQASDREAHVYPKQSDVPHYRFSRDKSFEESVGELFLRFAKNREDVTGNHELLRLLLWETKNLEYSMGANTDSLSTKYFNSDEEFDFEGDHVQILEGYAEMAHFLLRKCRSFKNFSCQLNAKVQLIKYANPATSFAMFRKDRRKSINITDACKVMLEDGFEEGFDFVACTIPLGVLKEAVSKFSNNLSCPSIPNLTKLLRFDPLLPSSKIDAIENVGFGLLNKIYLHFPTPFWRHSYYNNQKNEGSPPIENSPFLFSTENSFANISSVHPEYFIFKDIGMMKYPNEKDAPYILMTMASGKAAIEIEQMKEDQLVRRVLSTLRELFSEIEVPEPTDVRITRWGSNEFTRGCYAFLPPGCTDQDYLELAKPVYGQPDISKETGQAILTRRLFFAGEHATETHPSTAHGAYISGEDAAIKILDETLSKKCEQEDEQIPLFAFRMMFPSTPLTCQLCQLSGNRKREGDLCCFRKGNAYGIAHLHCASFSPAIDVGRKGFDGIVKEIKRGTRLICSMCNKPGATIGCSNHSCGRSYHYTCCRLTGWSFMRRGRGFFCGSHRYEARSSISSCSDSDQEYDGVNSDCKSLEPLTKESAEGSSLNNSEVQHILFSMTQSPARNKSRKRSFDAISGHCPVANSSIDSIDGEEASSLGSPEHCNKVQFCNHSSEFENISEESLTPDPGSHSLIRITHDHFSDEIICTRKSSSHSWNLSLLLETFGPIDKSATVLKIYFETESTRKYGLRKDDIILSIDGKRVGLGLKSWVNVVSILQDQELLDIRLHIMRRKISPIKME